MLSIPHSTEPERVTFGVRRMHAGDSAFVYANFLEPFRESDYVDGIPNTEFYSTYKAEWARVLATFTVLIAHPEGAEDEIAGFLAHRGQTIGWLYTKKRPWRGMGAARTLMEAAGFSRPAPLWALYGSSWGLRWFRRAGYVINLVPHASAERLLLGVGP